MRPLSVCHLQEASLSLVCAFPSLIWMRSCTAPVPKLGPFVYNDKIKWIGSR